MNASKTLFTLATVLALVALLACARDVIREVEVPGETIVVEKVVVKEVEVPGETIVVEKAVVKEVEVPGETIVVEKVVVKEVPVKETVIKEIPVEVIVEKVVEKEVIKEVPVEVIVERVVEKEVIREVPVEVIVEKEAVVEEAVEEVEVTESKVLNLRAENAVTKLSPYTAVSGYVGLIGNHIFSRLLIPDPHEQRFIPELAERWELAGDGSSVTFYLRKDALFHDGEPVTAEDVRWSFESYMDPKTKSRIAQRLEMVQGAKAFAEGAADAVEGIVVVDEHTVRFDMEYPTGQFIPVAGWSILPEHILGKIAPEDLDEHDFFTGLGGENPIGSGAWTFASHEPDQHHEFAANDDYFLGRPKIDRVFVHLIGDADAAQAAMQRGEIDANRRGAFTPEVNESFLADPRFRVAATDRLSNGSGYSFNFRTDWISDSRIHQAFMWALDRKQLIDTFDSGLGHIHNTNLYFPTGVETPEIMARYTPKSDAAKARQLLEQAGWDFSREVTVKGPDYYANAPDQLAAEQQMLADAGLKIKYEIMSVSDWVAVYYQNYNYDSVRVGAWHGAVTHQNFYFHSNQFNPMGYASPELDALLDAVPRALTNDDLVQIGTKMNEMFIFDLPIVIISTPLRLYTYGAHVWVPGFGRRPQPDQLKDITYTPEFAGQGDSWEYMMHEIDVVEFGTTHPLNETGPIAKQIAVQLGQ